MASARDEAYARFLRAADVASWLDCLRTLRDGDPDTADPVELTRTLVVAIYTRWLATLSGQDDAAGEASAAYGAIAAALQRAHRDAATAATGLGILLAMMRYTRAGRAYVPADDLARPEIALLFEPGDAARAVSSLQGLVAVAPAEPFRPLIYRYCHALFRLGAVSEAQRVLAAHGRGGEDDGMHCDLAGQLHEQAGRWREACATYERSPWLAHRYRAAICAAIRDGVAGDPGARGETSAAFRREMRRFSTEIDQAELARSMAFVDACRWNNFDSWLIQFELGKLAFRRRRHAEAEASLCRAADSAPADRRHPIVDLRFSNLTWLSGDSHIRDLPMLPEARIAARDVLACAGDPDAAGEDAATRIWLSREADEPELVERLLLAGDDYHRGRAHARIGDLGTAIDCWLSSLRDSYFHRTLLELIPLLHVCRMFATAELLIGIIERESWDDVFALDELGKQLVQLQLHRADADAGVGFDEALVRICARIQELARFDHQHAMRAYELFTDAGQHHTAEALLNRAEVLAEGVEEHLAIAVARRLARRAVGHDADPRAIPCLIQAERESRDRLERLQIAREYFFCGQPGRARRLLTEDGILGHAAHRAPVRLSHVEYCLALQCGPWLIRAEIERIAADAVEALRQDIVARRHEHESRELIKRLAFRIFNADEPLYLLRFEGAIGELGELHARTTATDVPAPDRERAAARAGPAWRQSLVAFVAAVEQGDATIESRLATVVAEFDAATPGVQLAMLLALLPRIGSDRADAALVRPDAGAVEAPIAESETVLDPRTQELCDLWKRVLRHGEGMHALDEFFAADRLRAERWQTARRDKLAALLRTTRPMNDLAMRLVARLERTSASRDGHPYFDRLHDALAADARTVGERLRARLARRGDPGRRRAAEVRLAAHPDRRRMERGLRDVGGGAVTGSLLRLHDRVHAVPSWFRRIRALTALGAPDTAQAETGYLHLSELTIENAPPLTVDSALVIAAVISDGDAGRSIGLFAVEDLARSPTSASWVTIATTDLVLGRIPFDPGSHRIALAAYQVPLVGLVPAVVEEIRGLSAAIDHVGDGPGSLAVCDAICDRIEVLAGVPGFVPLLTGAGRIASDERGWSYLLAGGDAQPPDDTILFATGGRLYDNTRHRPLWRFAMVELAGPSAGGFARALDQLRRQHRAALGTTPGDAEADDAERYSERDRRLRATRDLAVRYGESAFREWKPHPALGLTLGAAFLQLVPALEAGVTLLREGLYAELGLVTPFVEIARPESGQPGANYGIRIWNTQIVSGEARTDRALVAARVEALRGLDIQGEPAVNPANGNTCAWIATEDVPAAEAAKLTTWDAAGYVILHLSAVVRKNCASFFTLDMAAEVVTRASPELYRQVRKAPGGLAKLTTVLRLLLTEEIAIRLIRPICEEYLAIASAAEPSDHIAEALRNGATLRPYLQKKFPATSPLLELGPAFVAALAAHLVRDAGGRVLALDPTLCQNMLAAVRAPIRDIPPDMINPVLVVDDWRLRPHLRRLVELEFPHLAVLARRELADPDAHPRAALIELGEASR